MERRNFLAAGITGGISLLNLPVDTLAQTTKNNFMLQPFYLPPGEPLQPGPGNVDIRTIIKSKQTNRQLSNVEVAAAPKQMGPSPHVHEGLDELMYVLEGTATVMIEKRYMKSKQEVGIFALEELRILSGMPLIPIYGLLTSSSTRILKIIWRSYFIKSYLTW